MDKQVRGTSLYQSRQWRIVSEPHSVRIH